MAKPKPIKNEYHLWLFLKIYELEQKNKKIRQTDLLKLVNNEKKQANLGNDLMSLGKGNRRAEGIKIINCTKKNEGRGGGRKGYYSISYEGIINSISKEFFSKPLIKLEGIPINQKHQEWVYDMYHKLSNFFEYYLKYCIKNKNTGDKTLYDLFEGFVLTIGLKIEKEGIESLEGLPPKFIYSCYNHYWQKLNNPFILTS